jgi:hypothetical protein
MKLPVRAITSVENECPRPYAGLPVRALTDDYTINDVDVLRTNSSYPVIFSTDVNALTGNSHISQDE